MAATLSPTIVQKMTETPLFRQFQQAFELVTAVPLKLRAVESRQRVQIENQNQNHCCSLLCQTHETCDVCLKPLKHACEGVNGVACAPNCVFGFNETTVAVKVGKEIIAHLQTGQMFFKTPTREQTQRTLQHLRDLGPDFNPGEAIKRYQATPVIHRREYQAGVTLLQIFAHQLGGLANHNYYGYETAGVEGTGFSANGLVYRNVSARQGYRVTYARVSPVFNGPAATPAKLQTRANIRICPRRLA